MSLTEWHPPLGRGAWDGDVKISRDIMMSWGALSSLPIVRMAVAASQCGFLTPFPLQLPSQCLSFVVPWQTLKCSAAFRSLLQLSRRQTSPGKLQPSVGFCPPGADFWAQHYAQRSAMTQQMAKVSWEAAAVVPSSGGTQGRSPHLPHPRYTSAPQPRGLNGIAGQWSKAQQDQRKKKENSTKISIHTPQVAQNCQNEKGSLSWQSETKIMIQYFGSARFSRHLPYQKYTSHTQTYTFVCVVGAWCYA